MDVFDLKMTLPVDDDRPDNHFFLKYSELNRALLNHSEVKNDDWREALEVIDFVRKIKITKVGGRSPMT